MVKHKKATAPRVASKSADKKSAVKEQSGKAAPKPDKRAIARRTTAPGKARSQ